MGEKISANIRINYFVTIVIVVFASIMCAKLEYNYILLDALPYREGQKPLIGLFYYYHLEAIVPLIGPLAFQPFIYETLSKKRSSRKLRMSLALGVGSLLLGTIAEDISWFTFRLFGPLPSDPLAYQWIRPSDYTAHILGYARIFGSVVPLWYLVLAPPIIAIFAAVFALPRPKNSLRSHVFAKLLCLVMFLKIPLRSSCFRLQYSSKVYFCPFLDRPPWLLSFQHMSHSPHRAYDQVTCMSIG